MKRSFWLFLKRGLIPAFEPFCLNAGSVLRFEQEKRKESPWFLLFYVVNIIEFLFLSLHLILPFQNIISKTPHSFLFITTGQVAKRHQISPFYKNPLTFIYLHHFTNPNPINTPLLLSFFILLLLFFFLASCSQQRSHQERELLLLLPWTNHTPPPSTSLHHFVRTGSSFWIRAVFLLRRQDLGPVPSFWIGAELPFVGRSKERLR